MKIKRTIDGKEYEFELTANELSNAWYEEQEKELKYEADWAFDHCIAQDKYSNNEPRINDEPGAIPGSKAYRDAWRETFLDSWMMWEDHAWEEYMSIHPLAQYKEMTLNDMLPYVQETEKWLEAHPVVDREVARKAVMDEFRKSISGEGPMSGTPAEILDRLLKETKI